MYKLPSNTVEKEEREGSIWIFDFTEYTYTRYSNDGMIAYTDRVVHGHVLFHFSRKRTGRLLYIAHDIRIAFNTYYLKGICNSYYCRQGTPYICTSTG